MKPFLIKHWHGTPALGSRYQQKLDELCRKSPDGNLFFDANLTEFARVWADKFLFMPATEKEQEFIDGKICVTPHGSFDAR